jgi:hypothetical protein
MAFSSYLFLEKRGCQVGHICMICNNTTVCTVQMSLKSSKFQYLSATYWTQGMEVNMNYTYPQNGHIYTNILLEYSQSNFIVVKNLFF